MNAAKVLRSKRGGASNPFGVVEITHEAVETPTIKTMRPDLQRSPDELRRLRDLFWLFLEKQGLNITEIELVCAKAARDRSVIGKRLKRTKAYYSKMRAQAKAG
ncbi:MAG: hypothetical protein KGL39_24925 [Patescibacteria group bacterium]|nr:hypothetical protein [Patescibacteria group bacterium]